MKALSVFMVVWFLHPQTGAHAGTITFDDLSDDVTVVDTTGRITSSVCSTDFTENCFVTFSAPLHTVSVAGSPIALNVRESPLGRISDVVLASVTSTAGMIQFVSDIEGGAVLDPVGGNFVDETGTIQDAGSVTWTLADGSTVVDTIAFISDVEAVPEPGSFALLSIGLMILLFVRSKQTGLSA
jgi:hypothetical protein